MDGIETVVILAPILCAWPVDSDGTPDHVAGVAVDGDDDVPHGQPSGIVALLSGAAPIGNTSDEGILVRFLSCSYRAPAER